MWKMWEYLEEEEELEELEEEEELGEDEKEEEELSLSGHTGSREQLQILQFQIPNRENEYSVQTFPRNNINFMLDSTAKSTVAFSLVFIGPT